MQALGFKNFDLHGINHHDAHAAGAYFSGINKALVVTLDGIGDGLSGAIFSLIAGKLKLLNSFPGKQSLGIFFEHVTNLMNMRELEDEGKVMALANFAYPVPDEENPMLEIFWIDGLSINSHYSSYTMYKKLKEILWHYPSEQFCYMAQRTLEVIIVHLIKNSIKTYSEHNIILSGGVASNIKVNQLIRNTKEVQKFYVFPHMGDGGLALGAAVCLNSNKNNCSYYELKGMRLGPEFSDEDIVQVLKKQKISFDKKIDIVSESAKLIASGEIILWFQGRMELGPRALGGRSILALPGSLEIKDKLNLQLKKRVWYQPFCPSMLEDDACEILDDFNSISSNRFMTAGYMVKKEYRNSLQGVINVDGTCRPQIIYSEKSMYYELLKSVKSITGLGVLLNTSMNIHGEPLVCTPSEAVETLFKSGCGYLVIGDYLVQRIN